MNNIDLNIFRLEAYNSTKESHVECIEKLNSDGDVSKYLGNLFYMIDRIRLRREENFIDQIYIVYFHDKIIGFISISIIDEIPCVSYALLSNYRGESLGRLLLQDFTYYLQDYYHFDKIYVHINNENVSSKKTAKFVGYEYEGGDKYSIKSRR